MGDQLGPSAVRKNGSSCEDGWDSVTAWSWKFRSCEVADRRPVVFRPREGLSTGNKRYGHDYGTEEGVWERGRRTTGTAAWC